ncbi:MAG: hypothetical protein ACD_38C00148G0015 [uncultured bacterium]|uniref:GatB/YqeY domain-containing protein n=1 Tax=Candidatus Daviesbacteria bacterium GW2011_GWC2_40_12 TaxID=1618431 RepID=A0A0G0QX36_9BACT|nr:MAG: hypothetical protein ACD_38C00148G0015 [uncultured bacterium]KKQ84629.1 MAG: hypothetical protein UT04_C0013G0014 [Candidatus Daviesbacteria bacterium GW2011_GWF2_38_7]KKR16192.1 MAG: hypothetical protein UT45_C0008G0067 [Candidatus Daviesbacteria bacterium GW2011_GWA2_39_33]KKR25069.1 MAG: hypothetical protein UT54_C0007G0013 [Candidatus Daviesbacteria bacterium GW2011_GWB1_39_5]KKR41971.1 MAG: hypothetical protein UT77_C0005G0086 [Candidatus Daviesbacteria bacterium GW2011_GWC2_40_12]
MLLGTIQTDLKNAQLARDEVKVSALRMLLSEIHNMNIQKGGELSDAEVVSIVQREVKKRKEAAAGFRSGDREASAKKEEAELEVLMVYLPAQLSTEELTKIIVESINETGAVSISDMGKVIGSVMGKVAGRADGGTVSALVKEKLS